MELTIVDRFRRWVLKRVLQDLREVRDLAEEYQRFRKYTLPWLRIECASCGDMQAVDKLGHLTSQKPVCKKCSERLAAAIQNDDWAEYDKLFGEFKQ